MYKGVPPNPAILDEDITGAGETGSLVGSLLRNPVSGAVVQSSRPE